MWLYENHMVLNPGKCHYLIISKKIADESIKLGKKILHAETEQKFLYIIIDKDLNFQSHTNQKLSALIRVAQFMTDFNKKLYLTPLLKGSSIIVPCSGGLALEL